LIRKKKSKGISLNYLSNYYDCITLAEGSAFRSKQIDLIGLKKGERVLEVGCGTAALSILAKQAVGDAGKVDGIDLAPKMVRKAREKARKLSLDIRFKEASIDHLPYSDAHFDVVISSMMFHHLPVAVKEKGLKEIYRVLKKNGRLFLSDFCSPYLLTVPLMVFMFIWISPTRYQLLGRLPGLMRMSGFSKVDRIKKGLFLEYYLAKK
jgi:ubiquinone/menaquinone biosynthesis C-methylase UbiE